MDMDDLVIHGIAIVGISGRFPGAGNHKTFWENISLGKESSTLFSDDELTSKQSCKARVSSDFYVKRRGILEDIEFFDGDFFKISHRESELMDPQHRLFLECSHEALEDAGYDPDRYKGSIGVYGGTGRSTYFLHNLLSHKELMSSIEEYLVRIGNEPDFFTTKVSYKLNLKGPSLSIQTACSSSLVAICNACNHLLSYQCDMALAGGVSIFVPQKSGYFYEEGMIFSPDGHCRPFDALAQGTVPSNGAGVVVLKRLEDAVADRDHIYAVIRGYGINNDGGEKISYSAPSITGQISAIESAFTMAEVNPRSIGYIETHGTGTALGDPIEVEALKRAFRKHTEDTHFCALGSVKANIGHCMEAAGVVGLINAAMAIYHRKIPPLINFSCLNPQIDFKESPFYISNQLQDWNANNQPRRASVSSFGIGGTNAHAILEEAPYFSPVIEEEAPYLIVLSAKTYEALEALASN
ncbi:MAG: polyketide synthase, partial [Simkania negevensis]|nr:polyketide synthase [Simkania negevensis]